MLLVTQEAEVKQAGEVRNAADGGSGSEDQLQDHDETDKSTGRD